MPEYLAPGVYIEEVPTGVHSIDGVSTSVVGFIGVSRAATLVGNITSLVEFERSAPPDASVFASSAVRGFFDNGGRRCSIAWISATDPFDSALDALSTEPVSILCCLDVNAFPDSASAMAAHCERRKDRVCILQASTPVVPLATHEPPVRSAYAAYYHPWLTLPAGDGATQLTVPPGGHVAGVYASTDVERGVWKPLADVGLRGAIALSESIGAADATLLANRGINLLRDLPGRGIVVWGARTTSLNPEWKYVSVRRLLIYIERSLERGLQWAVFEPSGEPLWIEVRAAIEQFLRTLWRLGALMGTSLDQAYFVKCDRTTMTQDDIDNGRLVGTIGVAPVNPAEFVIFRIAIQSVSPLM